MRIAIDARGIEHNPTGVGRYLNNLLKYWQNDSETEFILYFKELIPDRAFIKKPNFKAVLLKQAKPSNAMWQHVDLPRQMEHDAPDIFFSPSYILPLYYPGKTAVTLHDIFYEAHPEWLPLKERFLLQRVSRSSAKKADHIFTVSEFSKKEIIRLYAVPESKITTAYLAVDEGIKKIDPSAFEKEILAFRKKHNIPDEFMFFQGSIFSRRHPKEMLEAFVKFKKETQSPAKFLMAGRDRTYPQENLAKLVAASNARLGEEAIIHIDYIGEDELLLAYNLAFCVIAISDYEGFGLQPLEALKCQTPSIVADKEISREIMGGNAFFVKDPKDTEEIKNAIKTLAENKNAVEKILEGAGDRLNIFSFEKCAKKTLEKLKETANV
jgi:hypothetical protein